MKKIDTSYQKVQAFYGYEKKCCEIKKDFVKSWSVYLDPKAIFTIGHEA